MIAAAELGTELDRFSFVSNIMSATGIRYGVSTELGRLGMSAETEKRLH